MTGCRGARQSRRTTNGFVGVGGHELQTSLESKRKSLLKVILSYNTIHVTQQIYAIEPQRNERFLIPSFHQVTPK